MFGRKILFLTAWYVAGNIVSSLYKSPKKWNKVPKKIWDTFTEFMQTQQNFLHDIEENYLNENQKKKFSEKKKVFLENSEKYIQEWKNFIKELQNTKAYKKHVSSLEWWVHTMLGSAKSYFEKVSEDTKKEGK